MHGPKIYYWLEYDYGIACIKLFVSSHHLNFGGVLAFMVCYSMKDKRDTTLPCFYYDQTNVSLSMHYWLLSIICATFHVAT